MRLRSVVCSTVLASLAGLTAQPAAAQSAHGFALGRFDPAERGSDWFALDSLDFRGDARLSGGFTGDFAVRPLVVHYDNPDAEVPVVRYQFLMHPGLSLVLWNQLRLGVTVPVGVFEDGRAASVNGYDVSGGTRGGIGDVRLGADFALFGRYGDRLALSAGARVYLPTGDKSQYLGDGYARVTPRLAVAGDIDNIAYAGQIGVMIRARSEGFAGEPLGSELQAGASVGVRLLDRKLLLGPELTLGTGISDVDAFTNKQNTPFEAIFGGHYFAGNVRVGAGVAPGIARAFGTPRVRYLFSFEWVPDSEPKKAPAPPRDTDGDLIPDTEDACPTLAGMRSPDPALNGCPPPPPPDRDRDGVTDDKDACPDIAGAPSGDPKMNGCPPDKDGDGVPDVVDACLEVAGVRSDDPKANGCPPPDPDRDHDGIKNEVDACPDEPGIRDADPTKNGCPAAKVVGKTIEISQQIKFANASAEILPESSPILDAVAGIMKDKPEIVLVRIEGHTDDHGSAPYNKHLSAQRADSVAKWLTLHGIDKARLKSQGFGSERPIDSNTTEEGRRNNRRVEFHIEDGGGALGKAAKPVKVERAAKADKTEHGAKTEVPKAAAPKPRAAEPSSKKPLEVPAKKDPPKADRAPKR